MFCQPGQLRRFLAEKAGKPFQAIYSPAPMSGAIEEHWEHVGRMAIAAGNMVLYVDEVNMLCTPNGMVPLRSAYWSRPENQKRLPVISDLLNYGRHAGVAMVMLSRMPSQVNRLLTQGCDEMRVFRQTEPGVIAYFRAKSESAAALIPQCGDFQYVLWQDGKEPIITGGRR